MPTRADHRRARALIRRWAPALAGAGALAIDQFTGGGAAVTVLLAVALFAGGLAMILVGRHRRRLLERS